MKGKFHLLAMLFVALLMVGCSDDEKGIRFTKDEMEGDILTGKQVGIEDNTLSVYTTEENTVNVQGASGKISAVSADEKIATVYCDNMDEKRVHVKGVAVGKTKITVTDADGNSATFIADVKDVESAWATMDVVDLSRKYCVVEGVSKEDSSVIASDVIAKNHYQTFVEQVRRNSIMDSSIRCQILDAQKNVLVKGFLVKADENADGFIFHIWAKDSDTILETFFVKRNGGNVVWDLTKQYQDAYPSVTKVELWIAGESLRGH